MEMMKQINTNYIYLLHEREFIRTSEDIYKVGMTRQPNLERFNNYPKGSILLFQMECIDCKFIESIVLQVFKDRFDKCCFYGNEYFKGNKKDMMNIIYLIITYENELRECTTDRRSNYIDSILNKHNIMDKVTTTLTNQRKPSPFLSSATNRGTPNTKPINDNRHLMANKHANTNPYKCSDLPPSSLVPEPDSEISNINKLIEENRELMKLLTYAMKSNQEAINNMLETVTKINAVPVITKMLETFTKINAAPVINNIYN